MIRAANSSSDCDPGSTTLARFLTQAVEAYGSRPAVVWNDRTLSFADLLHESASVANGLSELGIGRGDRVAIWMPNAPAWLALHFASAMLGAILVAINPRFRSHEVEDIIGRSGSRLLVIWPNFGGVDFIGMLDEMDPHLLGPIEYVVLYGEGSVDVVGDRLRKRVVSYAELAMAAPTAIDHGSSVIGSNIFTTSGTTSAPKFVLHSQQAIVAHASSVAKAASYSPDIVHLLSLPLCGIFGFVQAMAALASGSCLVMQASFDIKGAAELIRANNVTTLCASDEMLARLFAASAEQVPFPSLRWACFGSFSPELSDLPSQLAERGVRLVSVYGSSEMQAIFAHQQVGAELPVRAVPGGHLVAPTAQVRVRDISTGDLVGHSTAGELEVKGPSLMLGYFGDDNATAQAFTSDGFFRTGDLGRVLPDGSLVFMGRMRDVLRLGGYLVAPAEIESYIQRHRSVEACQVVDVAGPSGTVAVAFVTLRPNERFSAAALEEFCSERLAKFKVPRSFFCIDAFPVAVGPNGTKVQRTKLREIAAQRIAANR
ncbi:putative fatty acid CoA ligase [Bradyrhizobium sp. ORS 375]|uniref:AMP-binding protein n=1 Tax=Bradyrhizobium sp. (strain ORS 375) TaxID=566679 RepID=UPI0002406AA1|nr:AMP-binding protein [Bradyrhizobium sp. ORS 375]CCD96727.1 putative fatty acid CoA ligase [Bradyrhizobium sp. ORS 375]